DECKVVGDEDPRRRCDGDFGACRNASHRSRPLRLARASESWQRVAVPWRLRYSDRHWIRTLLRRRRKLACVDELDSSSRRIGAAVTFGSSHLARETDKASGSAEKTSFLGGEIDIV